VCGATVTGFESDGTLRHVGEASPVTQPDAKYADTFDRALAVARTAGLSSEEARGVVLALINDGLLRQRRTSPQR
jgi:hypothetical protein